MLLSISQHFSRFFLEFTYSSIASRFFANKCMRLVGKLESCGITLVLVVMQLILRPAGAVKAGTALDIQDV